MWHHKVPGYTTSQAAAFFYALTTGIYSPFATCFKVCWVSFGLSSSVFFLTSTPVLNYFLLISVGFNRRLEVLLFPGL